MKIINTSTITFLSLVLMINILNACSSKSQGYKGYETPEYDVLEQYDNIEIRKYKNFIVAEINVEGSREESVKKGFRSLAKYIFGDNQTRREIAMSSPVIQNKVENTKINMTSPVIQKSSSADKWIVQFMMPKIYNLENLPIPNNQDIKFKEVKNKKFLAVKFSGRWNDYNIQTNMELLTKFIFDKKIIVKDSYQILYYDDPFTLPWNRRNEIIVEIDSKI